MSIADTIIGRMQSDGHRFFANDNVSAYIQEGQLTLQEGELTTDFERVLHTLLIDTANDPNSNGK